MSARQGCPDSGRDEAGTSGLDLRWGPVAKRIPAIRSHHRRRDGPCLVTHCSWRGMAPRPAFPKETDVIETNQPMTASPNRQIRQKPILSRPPARRALPRRNGWVISATRRSPAWTKRSPRQPRRSKRPRIRRPGRSPARPKVSRRPPRRWKVRRLQQDLLRESRGRPEADRARRRGEEHRRDGGRAVGVRPAESGGLPGRCRARRLRPRAVRPRLDSGCAHRLRPASRLDAGPADRSGDRPGSDVASADFAGGSDHG